MNWLLITPLLLAAIIPLLSILIVWRNRTFPGVFAFTFLMLAIAFWALGDALNLGSENIASKSPWINLSSLGMMLAPLAWFILAVRFSGRTAWLGSNKPGLYTTIPTTLFLIHKFSLNQILIQAEAYSGRSALRSFSAGPAPAFWTFTLYTFILVLVGLLILLQAAANAPQSSRGRVIEFSATASIPWAWYALYLSGFPPFSYVNLTPFIFAITSPILSWAFTRQQPEDLLLITYPAILEKLKEGIVVLNTAKCILSANLPVRQAFSFTQEKLVGHSADEVFSAWPELVDNINKKEGRTMISVDSGENLRFYNLDVKGLDESQQQNIGTLLVMQELTAPLQNEQALKPECLEQDELYAALLAITAQHDISTILQMIVEQATNLLAAHGGNLFLCRPEKEEIYCVVSYNGPENMTNAVFQYGEGAAGKVAAQGSALLIDDYRSWPESVIDRNAPPQIVALISVPMQWQGQVTGVINIFDVDDNRRFTTGDLELLTILANQATIVYENTRLLHAERQQREQAETLREVTGIINSSLDRQQVLQHILEQLERVIEFDSASIMLVTGDILTIVADRKIHSLTQQFSPLCASMMPHIQEAIQQKQPIIIPDTTLDPRCHFLPRSAYIRCWLGVPLVGQNQTIGLLNLDKGEPGYYTQTDAELASAFGNQAAIAIENARLFEAAQQRAQEAETLRQATAAVVSTLNLEEALDVILVQLERVVPYDSASVQLLREGYLEIVGGRGWLEPNEVLGLRFSVPEDNPNTVVIETRKPYILNDTVAVRSISQQVLHTHIRSWLGVPLIVHDKVIGMLSLDSIQLNHFTERDASLVSAFADHVAIAIENARLYTAERRQVDESEALRATVADISSELELPKLLQAILERAVTLLAATGGELGLYDETHTELAIVSSFNMGHNFTGTRLAFGEGAMGQAIETCQPVLVDDYQNWDGRSPKYWEGSWHSMLAVPFMIVGRLVGAIGIMSVDQQRQFSTQDKRLLNLFAQQAAIAVDNARLYQNAREAAERRAVLHRVSQDIVAASLEPEGIYTAIHRAASKLMPTEAFALTLLNEVRQEIDAVYLIDREGRIPLQHFPINRGLSGRVIATGQSLNIADMLQELEHIDSVQFGDPEEVRSILAVPMRLGGKVIGMLSAQSYQPHIYSGEDQHLLEMLASYAAIALENARLFKEVQRLAITDPLTEVYNRRQLFVLGEREFSSARRFQRRLSVLILDIDQFKGVNDTFGHEAGDIALLSMAKIIQANIREIDILGRYGGDEFVVVLPEATLLAAYIAAERLREQISENFIQVGSRKFHITISTGAAEISDDTSDLGALIASADGAMYKAKDEGRNRVAVQ